MKIASLIPSKLRGECNLGFKSIDHWRKQRKTDYDLFKGRHYGSPTTFGVVNSAGRASDYQPVNLHQQLIRTLVPFLAMQAPLSDVTTKRADLLFECDVRQQVYDHQAEELRLHEVYRDAATDALLSPATFTLNLVKAGGEQYATGNSSLDMGKDTTRLIDLDDIAVDPNAKTLTRDRRFIAHRYPVDLDDALAGVDEGCYGALPTDYEDGILPNENICTPEEARDDLQGALSIEDMGQRTERVDVNDGDRGAGGGERLGKTIMLWDVVLYLAGEVWIVTMIADPGMTDPFPSIGSGKFLACYRWKGPAQGPVNVLTFLNVPFNKMGLSLAVMQRDLAEVADIIANKIFRQVLRTKTMTIYRGDQENMAATMRRSGEGGYIRGDPQGVVSIKDGGLVPEMIPASQYFGDHWQNTTGNMALASGSADTGKTATAFEGLMGRVQGWLDYLRTCIEQLATDDLRVRAWTLSQNPLFKQRIMKTIGQGQMAIQLSMMAVNTPQGIPPQMGQPGTPQAGPAFGGQPQGPPGAPPAMPGAMMAPPMPMGPPPIPPDVFMMQGTPEDFDIKCRAFSMQYQNPTIQAQMVMKALAETIPACMAAGLDPRPTMKILAKKLNEPELEDLVPDPASEMMAQQADAMAAAMEPNPSGEDPGYQQHGPSGRKLPGNGRKPQGMSVGGNRAMSPGPGTGSPRPMLGARPQATRPMAVA